MKNLDFNFLSASGRIRTYVAQWALDLQSSAIDRSATDAITLLWYVLVKISNVAVLCQISKRVLRVSRQSYRQKLHNKLIAKVNWLLLISLLLDYVPPSVSVNRRLTLYIICLFF